MEDVHEFIADDFALLLGVGDAFEFGQEALRRIHVLQFDFEVITEELLHRLRFVRAEEAVVHEDARQLVADGLVQKRRRHAAIHAAREPEQHVVVADLLADALARFIDE